MELIGAAALILWLASSVVGLFVALFATRRSREDVDRVARLKLNGMLKIAARSNRRRHTVTLAIFAAYTVVVWLQVSFGTPPPPPAWVRLVTIFALVGGNVLLAVNTVMDFRARSRLEHYEEGQP